MSAVDAGGTERPRVGFAGIGRMGLPMARNVLDAGFPLAVFNRTPENRNSTAASPCSTSITNRSSGEKIVVCSSWLHVGR